MSTLRMSQVPFLSGLRGLGADALQGKYTYTSDSGTKYSGYREPDRPAASSGSTRRTSTPAGPKVQSSQKTTLESAAADAPVRDQPLVPPPPDNSTPQGVVAAADQANYPTQQVIENVSFDWSGLIPQRAARVSPLSQSWRLPYEPPPPPPLLGQSGVGYGPLIMGAALVVLGVAAVVTVMRNN